MENKNDMFNKTPKSGKPKMFRFNLYWMYGLIFIMLVALYMTNDSSGAKELGWTEFQKLAQENVFDKMTVYNKKNLVEATVKNGKTEQVFGNMDVSKIGVSPKVYVKIPSADKFSDFYDKAVADSHIDTQVRFLGFIRPDYLIDRCMDVLDETYVRWYRRRSGWRVQRW